VEWVTGIPQFSFFDPGTMGNFFIGIVPEIFLIFFIPEISGKVFADFF